MKRIGKPFDHIVDHDHLRLADHKALKGKRDRPDVQLWLRQLESNLQRITVQLQAGSFPVGRCHQFVIHDPKERIITAPCFEERPEPPCKH